MNGLIILMPTRDVPTVETQVALERNLDGFEHVLFVERGLPVIEARDRLWQQARTAALDHPDWFVLHIDDDVYWEPGTLRDFFAILAVYVQELEVLVGYLGDRSVTKVPDYPPPEFFVPSIMGGGFIMHRPSLFGLLPEHPWNLLDGYEYEDQSFRRRLEIARIPTFVYTRKLIWHADRRDGFAYAIGREPHFVRDNRLVPTGQQSGLVYDVRTYGLPSDGDGRVASARLAHLLLHLADVKIERKPFLEQLAEVPDPPNPWPAVEASVLSRIRSALFGGAGQGA